MNSGYTATPSMVPGKENETPQRVVPHSRTPFSTLKTQRFPGLDAWLAPSVAHDARAAASAREAHITSGNVEESNMMLRWSIDELATLMPADIDLAGTTVNQFETPLKPCSVETRLQASADRFFSMLAESPISTDVPKRLLLQTPSSSTTSMVRHGHVDCGTQTELSCGHSSELIVVSSVAAEALTSRRESGCNVILSRDASAEGYSLANVMGDDSHACDVADDSMRRRLFDDGELLTIVAADSNHSLDLLVESDSVLGSPIARNRSFESESEFGSPLSLPSKGEDVCVSSLVSDAISVSHPRTPGQSPGSRTIDRMNQLNVEGLVSKVKDAPRPSTYTPKSNSSGNSGSTPKFMQHTASSIQKHGFKKFSGSSSKRSSMEAEWQRPVRVTSSPAPFVPARSPVSSPVKTKTELEGFPAGANSCIDAAAVPPPPRSLERQSSRGLRTPGISQTRKAAPSY